MDIPLSTLLQQSLFYGIVLSLLLSTLILVTLYKWPLMWLGDAPAEIQAIAGPMDPATKRVKTWASVLLIGILAAVFVAEMVNLADLSGGSIRFFSAAVSIFVTFMTFNVVDLLLIDWPLVKFQPRFAMLPGTEGMNSFGDFAFHFRGFLKGTVGITIASVVLGAAVAGLSLLL